MRCLEKYKEIPNCGDDFDLIYKEILDFCKEFDKTLAIDCATFHFIKDVTLLRGKIIVMRTSVNTYYNRCLKRFEEQNSDYTEEELNAYKGRKKKIFVWYKFLNEFIEKIDKL